MVAAAAVGVVDADVGEDLVEPGPDAAVVVDPVECAVGADEGFLDEVFGGAGVVGAAAGMADQFGLVFGHDGFEHFVMTRLERPDEVGIIDCH